MRNLNLLFPNTSNTIRLFKRVIFLNEGQKVEAPKDNKVVTAPGFEAGKKVGEQLNTDLKDILNPSYNTEKLAEVNSPVLTEQQQKVLKQAGVKDIKLEKAKSGFDATSLYFEAGTKVYANGKKVSISRAFITHNDTQSVEISKGIDANVTVIKIKNKDGSVDELMLEKEGSDEKAKEELKKLKETVKLPLFIGGTTTDGSLLAVFEDTKGSTLKDNITVYLGLPGNMKKLTVSEASRLRDGGTTTVKADGHIIFSPFGGKPKLDNQDLKELT